MEFQFLPTKLPGNVVHYAITQQENKITFSQFIEQLRINPEFVLQFSAELKKYKYAYFFETPSVSKDKVESKLFEFVLVPSAGLESIDPDTRAFDGKINNNQVFATNFYNLGKDAMLVIPCRPPGEYDDNIFSHLSNYMQGASDEQLVALWKLAGECYYNQIQSQNIDWWFSTSGLGVYWLHIRICKTPKYYHHNPFKK